MDVWGINERVSVLVLLLLPLEVLEVDIGHLQVGVAAAVLQEGGDRSHPVLADHALVLAGHVELVALVALVQDIGPARHCEAPKILWLFVRGLASTLGTRA